MPVAPVFAYIGTAVGASAATAVATGVAVTATAASVGTTLYSINQQRKAANAAAADATAVAEYNARLDRSEEQQVALDAQENIRSLRRDAATYMSRQASAYAANGVRIDTGSPLALRAVTAGRFEQRAQQMWQDTNAKQQRLESAAQVGVAEGAAQADQYHRQGVAAVINGASKVAGQLYGAYQSGVFLGTGTNNLSEGLVNPTPQEMLRGG